MIRKSPAVVGVALDTVQLTIGTNPVALRPVNSCKFFSQTRDPLDYDCMDVAIPAWKIKGTIENCWCCCYLFACIEFPF